MDKIYNKTIINVGSVGNSFDAIRNKNKDSNVLETTKSNYLMHAISSIGDKITSQEVDIFLSNFLSYGVVTEKEAKLLKVATSDNVLTIPQNIKDEVRAKIFKNMLINLVEE